MKHPFLTALAVVLVLPGYWSVEKWFQKRAVDAAVEEITRRIETPGYMVRKFGLKLPLRQVYQVYPGGTEEKNAARQIIEVFRDEVPRAGLIALKLDRRKGQILWYLYPLEACGEHYCPYDSRKLIPIPEIPAEDASEVYFEDYEFVESIGFRVAVIYEWAKTPSGALVYGQVRIADAAINPFDRAVRQLESSGPPDHWSQKREIFIDYDYVKRVEEAGVVPSGGS